MKAWEMIGVEYPKNVKWCASERCPNGCIYAVPLIHGQGEYPNILKIDTTGGNDSITLLPYKKVLAWKGCTVGDDGCLYGIKYAARDIIKFDPETEEVTELIFGLDDVYGSSACAGPNGMIYFFPGGGGKVKRYDTKMGTNRYAERDVGDWLRGRHTSWDKAVMANDGCIYVLPQRAQSSVLRFDPSDNSITYLEIDIGEERHPGWHWNGTILGPDGNIYGCPYDFHKFVKVDVANQTTSLVGPDLNRRNSKWNGSKWNGGIVGLDNCIYLIPFNAEEVIKFNPFTEKVTKVGETIDFETYGKNKYCGGTLAPNGYIYAAPYRAKRVLKIQAWSNWSYLKPRKLVEQGRAVARTIQADDDLSIVQHFIIHVNDDIFREVLEFF